MYMVVGRVVVPPDLPVGSVILTRDWTMSAPGGGSYRRTSGPHRLSAENVSPGGTDPWLYTRDEKTSG